MGARRPPGLSRYHAPRLPQPLHAPGVASLAWARRMSCTINFAASSVSSGESVGAKKRIASSVVEQVDPH